MTRSLLPEISLNGGFPDPPAGEPVRVVSARHAACGEATRVRLPGSVPARAVRRMYCEGCAQPFSATRIEELGVEGLQLTAAELAAAAPVASPTEATPAPAKPATQRRVPKLTKPKVSKPKLVLPKLSKPKLAKPKLPKWKIDPDGRFWKLASLPLAAVAVVVALFLLQGGDDEGEPFAAAPAAPVPASSDLEPTTPAGDLGSGAVPPAGDEGSTAAAGSDGKTKFVSGSTYSLALPAGWEQGDPSGGATFFATAPDGAADVSLWVSEDPKLEYPDFVSQSLSQLQALTGSRPEIVERVPGPTAEETTVRLAADSPEGEPTYEVTLRVNGAYRYYLATTVQPDASNEVIDGVELIAGSFTPEAKG